MILAINVIQIVLNIRSTPSHLGSFSFVFKTALRLYNDGIFLKTFCKASDKSLEHLFPHCSFSTAL